MLLQSDPAARPHFYLVAPRARPGTTGPQGERVAVLVARDVRGFDGGVRPAGLVLLEDQPLNPASPDEPFRHEAETAPYKPAPDVVVVDDAGAMTPGAIFGSVAIARSATGPFGPELERVFGWRSRSAGTRLALAGRPGLDGHPEDPTSLANFVPTEDEPLPDDFDNAFHNGQPLPGEAYFEAGHRLRFTDTTAAAPVQTTLRIPLAPVLSVLGPDGGPLQPPVSMVPYVDTVVMDRGAGTFTIVWRAVLPWQERFAAATLRVQ